MDTYVTDINAGGTQSYVAFVTSISRDGNGYEATGRMVFTYNGRLPNSDFVLQLGNLRSFFVQLGLKVLVGHDIADAANTAASIIALT